MSFSFKEVKAQHVAAKNKLKGHRLVWEGLRSLVDSPSFETQEEYDEFYLQEVFELKGW